MKKLLLLTAALVLVTAFAAPAQQTETRTMSHPGNFDGIVLSGTQDVYFDIGPAGEPLTLIGTKEDLDNTEIKLSGNTLTVSIKKGYKSKSKSTVQVYVKNPTLKSAKISGTGDIDISGKLDNVINTFTVSGTGDIKVESIDCKTLECTVSGTGDIECDDVKANDITAKVSGTGDLELENIKANTVTATVSGTGDMKLEGECKTGNFTASGVGDVDARNLRTENVKARTSGMGTILCRCHGNFEGRASGGKIELYEKPNNYDYAGSNSNIKKHY